MDKDGIKKVVRFVNRMHDSLIHTDLSHADLNNVFRHLHSLKYAKKRMDILLRYRALDEIASSSWRSMGSRAGTIIRILHKWEDPMTLFRTEEPVPRKHSIFTIMRLVDNGAKINVISGGTLVLVVPVSDFTLAGEDYEEYLFTNLRIEFVATRTKFYVRVTGPEYRNSGYCHPHIGGDGVICSGLDSAGGGDAIISRGVDTRDIVALSEIVESILHTYNPYSPFFGLGVNEQSCDSCGDVSDSTDECGECGHHVCENCLTGCSICDNSLCTDCANYCEDCGHHVCENCLTGCSICDNLLCTDCANYCEDCDHYVCDNCLTECGICGNSLCMDCANSCENCGVFLCAECIAFCEKCKMHVCETCKEVNHNDCEEDECPETEDVEETG